MFLNNKTFLALCLTFYLKFKIQEKFEKTSLNSNNITFLKTYSSSADFLKTSDKLDIIIFEK